jgi:hypothetical protein
MKQLTGILLRKSCYFAAGAVLLSIPAFAGPRGASNYGNSALATCGTSASFSGVSADCYLGSGGFPNDYLFNFNVASSSTVASVTSFTIDFGQTAPNTTDSSAPFGLVVGDSNIDCLPVVPCWTSLTNPPPFTVSGTVGTGSETFDFTDFTAADSHQVTVDFTYETQTTTTAPTITNITSTATATPEPGELALFSLGVILVMGVLVRRRSIA